MNFCSECGVLLVPNATDSLCEECDSENGASIVSREAREGGSELENLPVTKSGNIRKKDAMVWLENLPRASATDLRKAVLPKPSGFTGNTFETDISGIRVTGDARFIERFASLLTPFLDLENDETRLELSLQRTKVRDTKQYTGNYALYLSVAERSGK